MPAAITAAMIFIADSLGSATAMPAVAKAYATLLTGPPRSKHIIRPSSTPSRTALAPVRPFSQSVRPFWAAAIGLPITTNIRNPTIAEEISGITTTGMMPRSTGGILTRWIAITTPPASRPATRPPRKPALMVSGDGAADEARARGRAGPPCRRRCSRPAPGPGSRRRRRRSGTAARAQLSTWPQTKWSVTDWRLVDLVAADREAERDQQTARGDERDHVTDAGHQPLAEPGAEAVAGLAGPLHGRTAAGAGGRRDLAALGLAAHLGDQFGGPVDARLHPDVDGRLPGEPVLLPYRDVVREDHAVRGGDDRRVEPGEAGRALRLDDDLDVPAARPAFSSDSAAM